MTQTGVTNDVEKLVENYFATWNETDPARRRAAIVAALTPEASYLDPTLSAGGHDEFDAMVVRVQRRFPEHRFRLTSKVDGHHDRLRWSWDLVGPDEATVIAGVDFAVLAADGRLREITGFFETGV
jgi:SnoaL-like domain